MPQNILNEFEFHKPIYNGGRHTGGETKEYVYVGVHKTKKGKKMHISISEKLRKKLKWSAQDRVLIGVGKNGKQIALRKVNNGDVGFKLRKPHNKNSHDHIQLTTPSRIMEKISASLDLGKRCKYDYHNKQNVLIIQLE